MKKFKYLIFVTIFMLFFANRVYAESIIEEPIANIHYEIVDRNAGETIIIPARKLINKNTNTFLYAIDINKNISNNYEVMKSNEYATTNVLKDLIFKASVINYYSNSYRTTDLNSLYLFTQKYIWETLYPYVKVYVCDNDDNNVLNSSYQNYFDSRYREYQYGKATFSINENNLKNPIYIKDYMEDDILIDNRLFVKDGAIYANDTFGPFTSYYIAKGKEDNANIYVKNKYATLIDTFDLPYKEYIYYYNKKDNFSEIYFNVDQIYSYIPKNINKIATYGLYNMYDELIQEYNANIGFVSKDLYYGKYYLKQINNGDVFEKDDNVYEFEISETPNPITIDVKLSLTDVVLDASYCDEECSKISNEKFIISNSKFSETLTTDENGNASITLPVGTYNIRQQTGNNNYAMFNDNITITNKDNTTINVNIKNNKKQYYVKAYVIDKYGIGIKDSKLCLFTLDKELYQCAISNELGQVLFNDVNYDKYYLKQVEVSDIYELNNTELFVDLLKERMLVLNNYEKIIDEDDEELILEPVNNEINEEEIIQDVSNDNEDVIETDYQDNIDNNEDFVIEKDIKNIKLDGEEDITEMKINDSEVIPVLASNHQESLKKDNVVKIYTQNSNFDSNNTQVNDNENLNTCKFEKIELNLANNLILVIFLIIIFIYCKLKRKNSKKCK